MKESYRGTREEVEQAIQRLRTLETLILGAIMLVALIGGAIVAYLLHLTMDVSFRVSWIVLSILLFVIPGLVVILREGRGARGNGSSGTSDDMGGPHGR